MLVRSRKFWMCQEWKGVSTGNFENRLCASHPYSGEQPKHRFAALHGHRLVRQLPLLQPENPPLNLLPRSIPEILRPNSRIRIF